jgi:mRNA interferase YafQ
MRRIEWSNSFKRDYRRIKGTPRYKDLDHLLRAMLVRLQSDQPLPQSYRDHALSGDWSGCRDCHLRPDLLLIYEKFGNDVLRLVRLGSHSELFK